MKLLGLYNSRLQAFHYEELLQLYKQAIANGDFAGNKTFDANAINTLIQQSKDFASLPLASAGQRVTDDSLNNPLNLLTARFNAMVSEANDFDSRAAGLISVLEKDTILLDQLLAGANLQAWVADQPQLTGSTKFSWNYGTSNGPSSTEVSQTSPTNGVLYSDKCPTNTYLDVIDGSTYTGLVAPDKKTTISAKNMQWRWTKMTEGEQSEDLYGDAWTELNLLEDKPLINFLANPSVQTVLPIGGSVTGVFNVSGTVAGGSLPVYVRTPFTPRRNQAIIVPQNAVLEGTFEAGLTDWSLQDGWAQTTGADAHTGSKYMAKIAFPAWSSVTTYSAGDVISYQSKEYVALTSSNLNKIPSQPESSDWQLTGVLASSAFPLSPLDQMYAEVWVKSLAADGVLYVALSCRDGNDNQLGPLIYFPGISSADQYIMLSEVMKANDVSGIVAGRLIVGVDGQTTGTWSVDDVRVHLPITLSTYPVGQDDVNVYIPKTDSDQPLMMYFQNEGFAIDDIGTITPMALVDGVSYTVRFTENFPSYQCSINEKNWSPLIMLDPGRPYPDVEEDFDPIQIEVDSSGNRTLFPITDELGVPTGLKLQMVGTPTIEYYMQVTTPATPSYGAVAELEIDLTEVGYLNGLTVTPFSTYPLRLAKIETESFTLDTRKTIGAPNALIDRPMLLTFPTTLLRKIYLTLYQENYTLSEHVTQAPDALRRDTLFTVQTVLPFNVRRARRALPRYYRGAQYVFGVGDIAGIRATPSLPGIFIAGPHRFTGCPDVYRFDADWVDDASIPSFIPYLCWKAYDSGGLELHAELVGRQINIGKSDVFPFPSLSIIDRTKVHHVDIFLKFVINDPEVVLQRYLLQVTNV